MATIRMPLRNKQYYACVPAAPFAELVAKSLGPIGGYFMFPGKQR